jgi:hypothetical protein
VKRPCHRPGAIGACTAHLLPLGRCRVHDGGDAPEPIQQSFGRPIGDPGDRGERGSGRGTSCVGLRSLRVGGSAPKPIFRTPFGETLEPSRRVPKVIGSDDLHSQIHNGDANPSNRGRRQGSCVKTSSLDNQIGEPRHPAHATELRPELPVHDRKVETTHGLPFDDRSISNLVIARPQAPPHHGQPELVKQPADPIRLSAVDHDASHGRSINATVCRVSAKRMSKRPQLALSRSESA